MKPMLLRGLLATLLIATAAGKIWGSGLAEPDIRRAALAVLTSKGWPASQGPGIPHVTDGPILFTAPGCSSETQVYLIGLSLQVLPILDGVSQPGSTRRIVYLGRTWGAPDRLALRLEWLRWKLLSPFGLGRFVPGSLALAVFDPPGCHSAETIDWGLAWDRRTIAQLPAPANGKP